MRHFSSALTVLIGGVWLVFGLYCKVLNQVPRHEAIVAEILGEQHAPLLTRMIGVGEIFIAIWIFIRYRPFLCAAVQSALVITMNVIEFSNAQGLLHFGKLNIAIALIFVSVVWVHAYLITRSTTDELAPAKSSIRR